MKKEIDFGKLKKAIVEITDSMAVGKFAVKAVQAAMELRADLSAEQTRVAMLQLQVSGQRISFRLPYGQMLDPNDPARMVPNDYEQEVIQKVWALKNEGLSLRKIAENLTDLGYKPRMVDRLFKGRTVQVKGKWHHGLIRSILKRAETEKKN